MALLSQLASDMTWTMQICLWYSIVTCMSIVACLMAGGVGPRWEHDVESDTWHAGVAVLLVVSLAITELCVAVGGASNSYIKDNLSSQNAEIPRAKLPGSHDAWLTLLEYLTKLVTGLYMYCYSGGVAHTDSLAMNGARPVYLARFVQWSFAVPVLNLITNNAFIESRDELIRRSWTGLWAAFSFVWAAWLMEVTPYHGVRWTMLVLSLSGAVFIALDQFELAMKQRSAKFYGLKMGLLIYCKMGEVLYAAVFLLGRFGVIPPTSEQIFYAYSDASIKVFQGAILAMIRSREGAFEICRWCAAAMAAGNDLKDLLRQAKIPTLTIDLSGNIVQWNESISQLTGLQEAAVYGKPLIGLSANDAKEDLRRALEQKMKAFETGSSRTDDDSGLVELSIMTDMGQAKDMLAVRRLAMTFVPKRNAAGDLEGVTAIGQDLSEVTDLKMVQERKNALMAMLGHEIRSPLHGMMGLTSALMDSPDSKPMHRQLGMVKGCSARLLDLVNNIMDLAQAEKKKMDGIQESAPTAEVDLPTIVQEVIVMIGISVDKANKPLLRPGVRLVNNSVGAKVPLVRGDAHKCTQLLYNLMTNAAKFTERGSISVTFRHLPQEKRLEVDVTDTGKGISESGQKLIFFPFEQENTGDCRRYQGIGLGLAVCKEIAELHRGSLRVQSVVGQGSTFTFSLPCDGDLGSVEVHGEKEDAKNDLAKPLADSASPPPLNASPLLDLGSVPDFQKKPFILSVDDDDVNQEVIRNALSDICEVSFTMNGHETLTFLDELVKSKRSFPELVLLDIQMPGMSGFEVCEHIRSRYAEKAASLPVTMLSAKAPSEIAAIQSFDSGGTDFVAKPFNPQILRRKVIAALKLKTSGVRPSGMDVVASEASKFLKQHEHAAAIAKERAAALEAELNDFRRQAGEASGKVKALELELNSMKSSSESDKAEICKLLKERDDLQELSRSFTVPSPMQLRVRATAPQRHPARADSEPLRFQRVEKSQASRRLEADNALDMSFVPKLLASRLQLCRKSAKQCKTLLSGSLRPSVRRAVHLDATGIEESESEYILRQLTKLTGVAKVAVSELAMLEQIASNVDAIMHYGVEQNGWARSSRSGSLEEESTATSSGNLTDATI